jgi:hypothetical protein
MAQRDDISVRWDLSPRLITVHETADETASTEITIQDLHDTLRELEQRIGNMIYPILISTAGKEDLGGGVSVGLTATLQNAQINFEARYTRASIGISNTDGYPSTIIFTDVNATFIADEVTRGATITNFDDQSFATVVSVLSETTLVHEPLQDGYTNSWEIGDSYKIHNEIQCEITGGNLVAVDGYGNAIDPISPTAFVQVVRTSASSATDRNSQDIQFASHNGGVTYRASSSYSGIVYPVGTPRCPVNNFTDALTIIADRGLPSVMYILGSATIDSGITYDGVQFIGESRTKSIIVVEAPASTIGCEFSQCAISGVLDGDSKIFDCLVGNLNYIDGFVENSVIEGTIMLSGVGTAHFIDCVAGLESVAQAIIDCGGSGSAVVIRDYNGEITLTNKTGSDDVSIDINSGDVTLDGYFGGSGSVTIRGIGRFTNNGTAISVDTTDLIQGAVLQRQSAQTKYLIEDLRAHHSGVGVHYYWDPVSGDDSNDALLPDTARETFQSIHDDLIVDGNHDVIHLIAPGGGAGPVIVEEFLTITKSWLFIRGPGRDILIRPPNDTRATITIDGTGVEVFGCRIEALSSGTPQSAIEIEATSSFVEIGKVWITSSQKNGVDIFGGDHHNVKSCHFDDIDGYAISSLDGYDGTYDSNCVNNCGTAIIMKASVPNGSSVNVISGSIIREVSVASIIVEPNVGDLVIRANNFIVPDFPIIDNGLDTHIEADDIRETYIDAIHDESLDEHTTAGSHGQQVKKAADSAGLNTVLLLDKA